MSSTTTTTAIAASTAMHIVDDIVRLHRNHHISKPLPAAATPATSLCDHLTYTTDDEQLTSLLIDRLTRPATHLAQLNPITSPPSPISIPLPDLTPCLTDELFDDLDSGASSPSPPPSPTLTCADDGDGDFESMATGPTAAAIIASAPAPADDTAPAAYDSDDSSSDCDDAAEEPRTYCFTTAPSSLETRDDDDDEEEDDFPTIHHCPYRWIFTPHPSQAHILPNIECTPAPSHPASNFYSHTVHTPLQNSAFNNRLTVPFHTALNSVHPPMVLNTRAACVFRLTTAACSQDGDSESDAAHLSPPPALEHWAYIQDLGHWVFRPPGIRAQLQQGMFSVGRGPCLGMASRRAWEAWEERDLVCPDDEDEDELVDVVEEDEDEEQDAHVRVVERVSVPPAAQALPDPSDATTPAATLAPISTAMVDPAMIPCPASPPLPASYHIEEDDEPLPDPVW